VNQVWVAIQWWLWIIGFAAIAVASINAVVTHYYKHKTRYCKQQVFQSLDFEEGLLRLKKRMRDEDTAKLKYKDVK
jgi:hypothetical protein